MSQLGEYEIVRPLDRNEKSVVFEASLDGQRFLLSLIDSGEAIYEQAKQFRDEGEKSPYDPAEFLPHPNLVRGYPIQWQGEIAFAVVDYFEELTLGKWLELAGPVSIQDAVTVTLAASRACEHIVDDAVISGQLSPSKISIFNDGSLRVFAYVNFLVHRFEKQIAIFDPADQEQLGAMTKRLQLYSDHYFAPEFDPLNAAKRSREEFENHLVYELGCLLFELLSGQSVARSGLGRHTKEKFSLHWTFNRRLAEVPKELRKITERMIAKSPRARYSQISEVIDDFNGLGLASERVSFDPTSPPRQQESKVKASSKQREFGWQGITADQPWISRQPSCDFRRIRWGMTAEEIKKAEDGEPEFVMPYLLSFKTTYGELPLSLTYQFADHEGQSICVFAQLSLSPSYPASQASPLTELRQKFVELDSELDEKCKQLYRNGRSEEAQRLRKEHNEKLMAEIEQAHELEQPPSNDFLFRGRDAVLDVKRLNEAFGLFTELVTADFGSPTSVEDGAQVDLEYVWQIAKSEGLDVAEVNRHCRSNHWTSENTFCSVQVIPSVKGGRMLSATFASRQHEHLLPS